MDDALRDYLDHRFSTIDRRLDEIDAKIDSHAERMTSVEKDCEYVERRVHTLETEDRQAAEICRAAQKACRELVDQSVGEKISSATAMIKVWVVVGVSSILLMIVGYFVTTAVLEPVRDMKKIQSVRK